MLDTYVHLHFTLTFTHLFSDGFGSLFKKFHKSQNVL